MVHGCGSANFDGAGVRTVQKFFAQATVLFEGQATVHLEPEIAKPMERAFSALASAVRVPSPLGWAGMMGAFGAPRCAAAAAPAQATKAEMAKLQCRQMPAQATE